MSLFFFSKPVFDIEEFVLYKSVYPHLVKKPIILHQLLSGIFTPCLFILSLVPVFLRNKNYSSANNSISTNYYCLEDYEAGLGKAPSTELGP